MYSELIRVAQGGEIAPLVLKNGRVVFLPTGEIIRADVAIWGGYIAGVGSYQGHKEIDLHNCYVAPGLIESHVHIESSMVSPSEFLKAVALFGTTTVVADPHEIVNVLGLNGIKYMLSDSQHSLIDLFLEVPSCVPATRLETAGATVGVTEVQEALGYPRVIGLGEVMNFPGVIAGDPDMLGKIDAALQMGMTVAGHAPLVRGKELNAYLAAGVQSDHEVITLEEGQEKLRSGIRVLLRYGSAAKDIFQLHSLVNATTAPFVALCADDRNPEDLMREGHLNLHLAYLAEQGIDPVLALRLASLNPAQYYRLLDRGIIAPGKLADLVVYDDLKNFVPYMVFKRGELIAYQGQLVAASEVSKETSLHNTVKLEPERLDFTIKATKNKVRAIKLLPQQILTEELIVTPPVIKGCLEADSGNDLLKVAVIERHGHGGGYSIGFLVGYGLGVGAIAQTIAHDSHNVVVAGTDDEAMYMAVKRLQEIKGGIVLWDGANYYELTLPIAGLMSPAPLPEVKDQLEAINQRARELGVPENIDPVLSLGFIALPVIPHLRLTDRGLVDGGKVEYTSLFID